MAVAVCATVGSLLSGRARDKKEKKKKKKTTVVAITQTRKTCECDGAARFQGLSAQPVVDGQGSDTSDDGCCRSSNSYDGTSSDGPAVGQGTADVTFRATAVVFVFTQ